MTVSRLLERFSPLIVAALLFGCADGASRVGLIRAASFPPLGDDVVTLGRDAGGSAFWHLVAETLAGWAYGLGIAVALAVPLGLAAGSSEVAYRATRGLVEFVRPVPSVALVPLAVVVWGATFTSKLFLVVFATFWPLFVQCAYGARDVDPMRRESMRSIGAGLWLRTRFLLLPSALPYLAAGLRIASSVALVLAVTAELVLGVPGLGAGIVAAEAAGRVRSMYALVLAAGLLGWLLNLTVRRLERRVLRWHPGHRRGQA